MHQSLPELASVVNFVLLVAILVYLLRKPIKSFLIDRSETIEKNLRESEALREEALTLLQSYQTKMSRLSQEVDAIMERAKKEGEKEKERILERAEKMSQKIIDDAKRSAERQAQEMRKNIEKQFMEQALKTAKVEITKKVSKDEHQMFVDDFISKLEGTQHGIR